MEISSNSTKQTKKIGEVLAEELLKVEKKKAIVINLQGELGGGKTTFTQGFARGLGIRSKILSPTFNIFKKFPIKKGNQFKFLFHFDCYRIEKNSEIINLGFQEIVENPENIVIIEWGNRIKEIIPTDAINIKFKVIGEKKRIIIYENKLSKLINLTDKI